MTATNDGGQAYPTPNTAGPEGLWSVGHPGMSLRDWFAGMALTGVIERSAEIDFANSGNYWVFVGREVYALADAMLAEREVNNP